MAEKEEEERKKEEDEKEGKKNEIYDETLPDYGGATPTASPAKKHKTDTEHAKRAEKQIEKPTKGTLEAKDKRKQQPKQKTDQRKPSKEKPEQETKRTLPQSGGGKKNETLIRSAARHRENRWAKTY